MRAAAWRVREVAVCLGDLLLSRLATNALDVPLAGSCKHGAMGHVAMPRCARVLNSDFRFHFPAGNMHLTASRGKVQSGFRCWVLSQATEGVSFISPESPESRNPWFSEQFPLHFSFPYLSCCRNLPGRAAPLCRSNGLHAEVYPSTECGRRRDDLFSRRITPFHAKTRPGPVGGPVDG